MSETDSTHLPKDQWFETLEKRISSAAVLLELPDERIVTVKAWYKKYWSLPGGVVDAGESPQVAAAREVSEEVGLSIDPATLQFRWVLYRSSATLQSYQFTFHATISEADVERIQLQADEIDEYALVSKQEVLDQPEKFGSIVQAWARNQSGYLERDFTSSDA